MTNNFPPGVTGSEPEIVGADDVCDECADGNHADCEGGDCGCDCREMTTSDE